MARRCARSTAARHRVKCARASSHPRFFCSCSRGALSTRTWSDQSAPSRPRPHSLEPTGLFMLLRYHRLPIGRFPMLAYLACCEDIYRDAHGRPIGSYQGADAVLSTGDGYDAKARTCFQPHCNRKRCPTAPPLQHRASEAGGEGGSRGADRGGTRACDRESGRSGFKYDSEGSAAIINAELLSLPGASLAVGAGPPARVEITLPLGAGGRLAHMFFCFGCDQERRLTPSSNMTAGCASASAPHPRPGSFVTACALESRDTHQAYSPTICTMPSICASQCSAATRAATSMFPPCDNCAKGLRVRPTRRTTAARTTASSTSRGGVNPTCKYMSEKVTYEYVCQS